MVLCELTGCQWGSIPHATIIPALRVQTGYKYYSNRAFALICYRGCNIGSIPMDSTHYGSTPIMITHFVLSFLTVLESAKIKILLTHSLNGQSYYQLNGQLRFDSVCVSYWVYLYPKMRNVKVNEISAYFHF